MCSIAEGIQNEIKRVTELKERYVELRNMPNVIVEPQIAMMQHAIERAVSALAQGDVIEVLRSYEHLKSFEE